MLRLELDAIAKAIRDTSMSQSARDALVRALVKELSLLSPTFNKKRFVNLSLPLEK